MLKCSRKVKSTFFPIRDTIFLSLHVSVLRSLLEDHEDSSTESTVVDGDPPRTLPQLINLSLSECQTLNCWPHWIGLLSLHTLTLNANFMLLLETQFSFQVRVKMLIFLRGQRTNKNGWLSHRKL